MQSIFGFCGRVLGAIDIDASCRLRFPSSELKRIPYYSTSVSPVAFRTSLELVYTEGGDMSQDPSYALSSGNRVIVDDSGIRVTSSMGEQLASFDFSDLRSATRSQQGVTIASADGSTFDFLCDASTAEGLATTLSGGIQSESRSSRSGGLRGIGSRVQERSQQMAHNAQARVDTVRTQQAVAAGIDPNTPVDYDNAQQMQRIQGGLIPGEQLYAVYDMKGGGTGFVGITDRRLIIQDEGKIRKKRSLISIPYSRITMLASKDEGGMLRSTSELTVIAGNQEFELEFRSGNKAERAYTFIIQHLT
ncbi:MAG: PH domain-containing protein [Thermomicrobiales bacterium]